MNNKWHFLPNRQRPEFGKAFTGRLCWTSALWWPLDWNESITNSSLLCIEHGYKIITTLTTTMTTPSWQHQAKAPPGKEVWGCLQPSPTLLSSLLGLLTNQWVVVISMRDGDGEDEEGEDGDGDADGDGDGVGHALAVANMWKILALTVFTFPNIRSPPCLLFQRSLLWLIGTMSR